MRGGGQRGRLDPSDGAAGRAHDARAERMGEQLAAEAEAQDGDAGGDRVAQELGLAVQRGVCARSSSDWPPPKLMRPSNAPSVGNGSPRVG